MIGGWLALLAAATFAFGNVTARRGVIQGTVLQGLAITVPIGVPLFLAVALISGAGSALFQFTIWQVLSLSAAGICHFTLARYCAYRSVQALGSNLAAPVQRLSLPISLALALWLLGEYLTPLRALGIVLVIFGPIIMLAGQVASGRAAKRKAAASPAPTTTATTFQPRFREGYFFAVLSAAGYGISPLFVRAALQDADITTAIAGGVFSYAAATLLLAPVLLKRSNRRTIFAMPSGPAKWFLVSGMFTAVSQMIRYMALALAPVTVVSSIMVSSLVFRFLFSRIINRDHEIFSIWVIVGIAITILGSLALTLELGFVLSVLPQSDWLQGIAEWRLPASRNSLDHL
jgi:drug/metabolite transporter (DMT)-like permease